MRDDFTADWAFGIKGVIENIVRNNFPQDLRSWPLLQAFNFEAYSLPNNYMALILKDKLSGIPAGPGVATKFQYSDHPTLPPKLEEIELWQFYLRNKFSLKPEDACVLIPVHDSGKNSVPEDYKLFSAEEKMFWDHQIKFVVSSYKAHLQTTMSTKPEQPVNITYNVTGTNSRVNINSSDSSTNTVTSETVNIFTQLRDALNQIGDEEQRETISTKIDAMESSHGTSGFLSDYQGFMASAANHMTVFAPLLPSLAQLLA